MAAGWDPPLCKNIKIKQKYKNRRNVIVGNDVQIFGIQETSTIYKCYLLQITQLKIASNPFAKGFRDCDPEDWWVVRIVLPAFWFGLLTKRKINSSHLLLIFAAWASRGEGSRWARWSRSSTSRFFNITKWSIPSIHLGKQLVHVTPEVLSEILLEISSTLY